MNTTIEKTPVLGAHSLNWRSLLRFLGPGLLVAVGYMDPGNWATDLQGGAKFGYTLLSVIFISNIFAIVLQYLALKLGIVTGKDLAQACRDYYSRPTSFFLWFLCEIAIAACDLAEVLGSAIALNLLFGLPYLVGIVITSLDVLLILYFQNKGYRYLEILVGCLIFTIFGCFAYEILLAQPAVNEVFKGFMPNPEIIKNPSMLLIAIGILGATVMPHNLYLHSSIVKTREIEQNESSKRAAIIYATIDSTAALLLAFLVNAAILMVAASVFHAKGETEVGNISTAYKLLSPTLGVKAASVIFALALLASGQNSTITGTLAGQIVMEGFLDIRIKPWIRRLLTRSIAIIPAFFVVWYYGEAATDDLLLISQVVLSLQLSFAVFPLVAFTTSKAKMGVFANSLPLKIITYSIAFFIGILNIYLVFSEISR